MMLCLFEKGMSYKSGFKIFVQLNSSEKVSKKLGFTTDASKFKPWIVLMYTICIQYTCTCERCYSTYIHLILGWLHYFQKCNIFFPQSLGQNKKWENESLCTYLLKNLQQIYIWKSAYDTCKHCFILLMFQSQTLRSLHFSRYLMS